MNKISMLKIHIDNVYRYARNGDISRSNSEMENFLKLGVNTPCAAMMRRFEALEACKKAMVQDFDNGCLDSLTKTYKLMCKVYNKVVNGPKIEKLMEDLSDNLCDFYPTSFDKRQKILNRLRKKAERS